MTRTIVGLISALILVGCSAPAPTVDIHTNTQTPVSHTAAERAVLSSLEKIDPGLTENQDRALRRAERVCDAPKRYDGDEVKVLDYTRQEFDGGHASVDAAKAQSILSAIRASGVCPG